MRLLLIEDSERLRRSIVAGLVAAGYAVDTAADGETGLWMASEAWAQTNGTAGAYDVILLDLMLPALTGIEVLASLRARGCGTHVLILTARDSVDDRVKGLRAGADDYLPKPFAFEELLARVEALCRRAYGRKAARLEVADLIIDRGARSVTRKGVAINLAPREYALLEYLALRAGEVVTRADIEAHLYDENADLMSNSVDAAVYALRRRIQPDGTEPLVHTRRGHGYVLSAP
jgi:DNA-binding response OmpR family regulator